jgi:hypothetical protein
VTIKTKTPFPETIHANFEAPVQVSHLPEDEVMANHPILQPDNDMLYNRAFDYVFDHLDKPLDMEDMAKHLQEQGIRVSVNDRTIARLNRLMGEWTDEMAEHLAEEHIRGQWVKQPEGLVFASNPRDVKIRSLAKKLQSQRTQPSVSAEQIRDAIWHEPETAEPEAETRLKPESELSPKEKGVLAYLSKMSVRLADTYPTEQSFVDTIVEKSNLKPDAVQSLIGGLVTQQFLARYRKGGETYVTTNFNVAEAESARRRPQRSKNTAETKQLDIDMANELVATLLAVDAEKYTPKKLRELLQAKKGIDEDVPSTTSPEAGIKEVARMLAKAGVLTAGNFKPQEDGVTRSSKREGFRIGLDADQRERLEQMAPGERSAYIAKLLS